MAYKPPQNYNVPMRLLKPIESKSFGVNAPTFTDPEDSPLFFGTFRTFNGTEHVENGVFGVLDTAVIDCRYRPDINSRCRIFLPVESQSFEIIGTPEDIDRRHQFMQFRVQRVGAK